MIRYASCVWDLPMPTTFRAYQPDQPLLLPPDLQEWVPPGHLAHHVSDVVDALDLTALYAPYEGDGRRNACPFHLFHRASQRRLGSPARTSF